MQNQKPEPLLLTIKARNGNDYRIMDLRRRILQALHNNPSYIANDRCLLEAVREYGHAISRDQLLVELAWLDQIACVINVHGWGSLQVASLTDAGLDVVEGTLTIPGIATP